MYDDGPLRIALLSAWDNRCAWCRRHVTVVDIEIDHVIPQSIQGDALSEALHLHALPSTYDLQATYNLVPSCRRCNNFKRAKIPPAAPVIALFLQQANRVAVKVDGEVERLKKKRSIDRAIAVLTSHYPALDLSPESLAEMESAALEAQVDITEVIGHGVPLHPALSGLANAGAWEIVEETPGGMVVVRDGERVGYTSGDDIMICNTCSSKGPWNGSRCLTCGTLDDGD